LIPGRSVPIAVASDAISSGARSLIASIVCGRARRRSRRAGSREPDRRLADDVMSAIPARSTASPQSREPRASAARSRPLAPHRARSRSARRREAAARETGSARACKATRPRAQGRSSRLRGAAAPRRSSSRPSSRSRAMAGRRSRRCGLGQAVDRGHRGTGERGRNRRHLPAPDRGDRLRQSITRPPPNATRRSGADHR
jgi:hypothetical protein